MTTGARPAGRKNRPRKGGAVAPPRDLSKRTRFRDLTKEPPFGRLTVLEATDRRSVGGHVVWLCKCSCGNQVEVVSANLTTGNTTSCGCLQLEVSQRPGVRHDG